MKFLILKNTMKFIQDYKEKMEENGIIIMLMMKIKER